MCSRCDAFVFKAKIAHGCFKEIAYPSPRAQAREGIRVWGAQNSRSNLPEIEGRHARLREAGLFVLFCENWVGGPPSLRHDARSCGSRTTEQSFSPDRW